MPSAPWNVKREVFLGLLSKHREFESAQGREVQTFLQGMLERLVKSRPAATVADASLIKFFDQYHDFLVDVTRSRASQIGALAARFTVMRNELRLHLADAGHFNPFDVLRVRRREYVHSNLLAWLLDPLGSHGAGLAFLNAVLAEAGLPAADTRDRLECAVRREVSGKSSIVDVLVDTPRALLIIENKVDAEEGAEQTDREYQDFAPLAAARPFAAVFLTPKGDPPNDQRFLAWSYEVIWRLLGTLHFPESVGTFIGQYRDMVALTLLGGAVMAKQKDFRPETKFVMQHLDDVRLLQDAVDIAEADIAQMLSNLQGALSEADWWDDDGFDSGTEKGGIYVRKKSWGPKENSFWLGVADFSLNALTGGDDNAFSYVHVPRDRRNESVRSKLAEIGRQADPKAQSTLKYPFWRHVQFTDLDFDPTKLGDRLLTEFELLARFIAMIDEIVRKPPYA